MTPQLPIPRQAFSAPLEVLMLIIALLVLPPIKANGATVSVSAIQSLTLNNIEATASDLSYLQVTASFYNLYSDGSAGNFGNALVTNGGVTLAPGETVAMTLGDRLYADYRSDTGIPAQGTRFTELTAYFDIGLSLAADAFGSVSLYFDYSAGSFASLMGSSVNSGGFGESSTRFYDAKGSAFSPLDTFVDIALEGSSNNLMNTIPLILTLQPGDSLTLYMDANLRAAAFGDVPEPTPIPLPSSLTLGLTGLMTLFATMHSQRTSLA